MNGAPRILTAPYYDRLEDLERRHWWCRSVRRAALSWASGVSRKAAVLDAGCGTGGFLAAMGKRGFLGRSVGIDVAAEALVRARRGKGLVRLAQGSVSALPIAAETQDLVVLHDVLQHLPEGDDRRALEEAYRVLKPGGVLLVRANVGAPIAGAEALHRRYGPSSLASIVRAAGFRIERHRLLHPALALLGRLRAREAGHSKGGESGLATRVPAGPVNSLLDVVERAADAVVCRLPFRMPVGDVQILRGRKTASSARRSA
ncbi:MAG: class I SAM-dependent methyltransferase [Thermoanaerobaculia bacterium]